ncbi:uncharacterized protein [Ptychodera flava]|uniref:uncharacterized protein n=1 Tax=Ptychodera flava TaxID=63121 RepID=UPI003969CE5D
MPTCVCAVSCCSNNTRKLRLWKKFTCKKHQCNYGTGRCVCSPPFTLFPFPTEMKDPETRKVWTQIVCQNIPSRINWAPTRYDRVCSKHFPDGMPTAANPYPVQHLRDPDSKSVRRGRSRQPGMIESMELPEKMRKIDDEDLGRDSLDDDDLLDDSEDDVSDDSQEENDGKNPATPEDGDNTSDKKEEKEMEKEKTMDDDKLNESEKSDDVPAKERMQESLVSGKLETVQQDESPMDLISSSNSTPSTSKTNTISSDLKVESESCKMSDQQIDQQDPPVSEQSNLTSKESDDTPIDLTSSNAKDEKSDKSEKSTVLKEKLSVAMDIAQPINLKSNGEAKASSATVEKTNKQQTPLQKVFQSKHGHQGQQHSNSAPSSRSSTPVQSAGSLPRNTSFTMTPSMLGALQEPGQPSQSKYNELLSVIEDLGRDVRPTYSGSKTSMERLKRGITYARVLLQQCKVEVKRSARY